MPTVGCPASSVAALIAFCGGSRDAVFNWLAVANQTKFAQLAPLVIECAASVAKANEIMLAAGVEVAKMANALDATATLPIALCGGLAEPMLQYLPQSLAKRVTRPEGDSASGALILIKNHFLKCLSEG